MNAVGLDVLGIARPATQAKTQQPAGQPPHAVAPGMSHRASPQAPQRQMRQKRPGGLNPAQVAANAQNVAARAIASGNRLAAHAPSRAVKKFMSTNAQRSQSRRAKSGQKLANLGRQLQKIASTIPTTGVHGQDDYDTAPHDDQTPSGGGGGTSGGADWVSAWLEKFIPAVNTYINCMSAIVTAGDIAQAVGALSDQLSAAGKTDLANQGYAIANAAQDVIDNAQDLTKITRIDQVDTSVIGKVQQIQAQAQAWQAQASAALAPSSNAPGGGGAGDGGGGGGGGGFGGGGGGDLPGGNGGGDGGGFDLPDASQDEAANAALDEAQATDGGQPTAVDPSISDPTQDPSYNPLDDQGENPYAAWASATLDDARANEDASDISVIQPDAVVGLDYLGAMQARQTSWDEVRSPTQVIILQHGIAAITYGDPLAGIPSGVARVTVQGGSYWQPAWGNGQRNDWDSSGGIPPTVVVYFADGTVKRFPSIEAVNVSGGALRRGVTRSRTAARVVGAFDVGKTQHDLDAIKPVTVAQATVLLKYGQTVIDAAIKEANKNSLPGGGARQDVYWKLDWHANALSKLVPSNEPYGAGDDLKKWVQQAFIEFNAMKEGAAYAEQNWNALVAEIKARAVKVPETILDKAGDALGALKWVAVAGGVVLGLVVLGFGGLYVVKLVRS